MESHKFRFVFPSYDWDDVWMVNQIINRPAVVGREEIGFVKGVPQEAGLTEESAIRRWIDENMEGCSCLILFVGEKTHESQWVKYELELASKRGMGQFIVHLQGMPDKDGVPCRGGPDPYRCHGLYSNDGNGYVIRQYNWLKDDGAKNIGAWIEEACSRTSKYRQ